MYNIEILNESILKENKNILSKIEKFSNKLKIQYGWHYLLDIIWILKNVENLDRSMTILDVGAGKGILQYLLSDMGFNVISLDFTTRTSKFPYNYLFNIEDQQVKKFDGEYIDHLKELKNKNTVKTNKNKFGFIKKIPARTSILFNIAQLSIKKNKRGKITLITDDMITLETIENNSIDILVSLSAIEHVDKKYTKDVIKQFQRILKNTGKLFITTSATHKQSSFYHDPSKGWCFSITDFKELFNVSNFKSYNSEILEKEMEDIKNAQILPNKLSKFYYLSGNNGMPWGKWDPKYLPIGIYSD